MLVVRMTGCSKNVVVWKCLSWVTTYFIVFNYHYYNYICPHALMFGIKVIIIINSVMSKDDLIKSWDS